MNKINKKDLVNYWIKSSEEDLKTADSLFLSKRYHHCLFFCHLFIEKILKALIVKESGKQAPYGHKLFQLAKLINIVFSDEQLDLLDEVTAFNIEARYNDYKFQFYKKADRAYSKSYFEKSKRLYLWLRKKI